MSNKEFKRFETVDYSFFDYGIRAYIITPDALFICLPDKKDSNKKSIFNIRLTKIINPSASSNNITEWCWSRDKTNIALINSLEDNSISLAFNRR